MQHFLVTFLWGFSKPCCNKKKKSLTLIHVYLYLLSICTKYFFQHRSLKRQNKALLLHYCISKQHSSLSLQCINNFELISKTCFLKIRRMESDFADVYPKCLLLVVTSSQAWASSFIGIRWFGTKRVASRLCLKWTTWKISTLFDFESNEEL